MLRPLTALAILGLLALVFVIGLNSGNTALSGLLDDEEPIAPMVNGGNGQTITLEMVQKDLDWHRDTAEKLRQLD